MTQFSRLVSIHLYKIIILILFILTVVATYFYYKAPTSKIEPLLAGLVTGLFVAIIQYLLQWNEHREVEAIKKLGVKGILPHRDDRNYYKHLLSIAQNEIVVMGNTASRFFEDFAHRSRTDSRTLFEALARGVKVRILLPLPQYVPDDDRQKAEATLKRLQEIAKDHSGFDYRHFSHSPAHSLVKVDEDCLFGPIFAHAKSKDSPTIHADANSVLVKAFLQYFDNEWKDAKKV